MQGLTCSTVNWEVAFEIHSKVENRAGDTPRGLGGVVVIDAAIGAHGRGSRPAHYFTVAATLEKSLTSHCL